MDGKKAFAHEDIQNFAGDRRRSRLIPTGLQDSQTYMSTDIDLDLHERLRFGCYLSHIHLWEKIVASKSPYAIILEDDVSIRENFYNSTRRLINNLPLTWDIFYLNSCQTRIAGLFRPGIVQLKGALCTYGYAISTNGAKKLLRNTARQSDKPVDHMLDEAIYSSLLHAYHASPPLIVPRVSTTTLAYPHR